MAIISTKLLTLTLISLTLIFFFLNSPNYPSNPPSHSPNHRSLLLLFLPPKCQTPLNNYYTNLHTCLFRNSKLLSVPFLTLTLLLQFYILVKTAQDRFSLVVTKLSDHLNLSPSMGAVTLLALGNGAPDVFASIAAVRTGHARTGFGAILSAGTFVSAFVVGFVAIYSAPFAVEAGSFVRDVLFYLTSALFLFYVYLSGEIWLWQAVGFVGFYVFFVGFVFWMDFGVVGTNNINNGEKVGRGGEVGLVEIVCESGGVKGRGEQGRRKSSSSWIGGGVFGKISLVWEVPVSILLNLTVPQTSPSQWSRFYQSANVALCPLALLYSCKSFMPLDHPIIFLIPNIHFPLWSIVLCGSSSLAILHYIVEKEPPKTEQLPAIIVAFMMSVFWISTVAGELLNCLTALGVLLELPASLLGMTVLAWGNSVGDLVADVAVAKAGQPAMAMAGCFAGPMFNMLFGLGTALVIQTANVFPKAYELHFHTSIVIAFIFLILSLMGSVLVVTWCRFRVPRFWGYCLVALYVVFMFVSLVIAKFTV